MLTAWASWNTFVRESGELSERDQASYIPKWSDAHVLGNSLIFLIRTNRYRTTSPVSMLSIGLNSDTRIKCHRRCPPPEHSNGNTISHRFGTLNLQGYTLYYSNSEPLGFQCLYFYSFHDIKFVRQLLIKSMLPETTAVILSLAPKPTINRRCHRPEPLNGNTISHRFRELITITVSLQFFGNQYRRSRMSFSNYYFPSPVRPLPGSAADTLNIFTVQVSLQLPLPVRP